jgi:transcriptional regulator with XRE-family HTH domain
VETEADAASLGRLLRARRAAAGRTIASVAVEAGLSVPYIANLENGRGNPTLAALQALAGALGARLRVVLDEDGPGTAGLPLPDTLARFARGGRFAAEAARVARAQGVTEAALRARLLSAMAAMGALCGRTPTELDWHRVLDTAVLLAHDAPGG